MQDLLILLGLVVFIALFAFAIIHTGRKQRKAKARVFKEFADRHGLRYREEDDGDAQVFAEGFDGIGQFSSPSLGKVIPKDVVHGELNGVKVILFRHSIRYAEGWAREWFVSGLTSAEPIAKRCAIQFFKSKTHPNSMYFQDPIVKDHRVAPFNLAVRAASQARAGKFIDPNVLNRISGLAAELPFRPEIQVRGNRVAAYPADRSETIDDVATLERLLAFTRSASQALFNTR